MCVCSLLLWLLWLLLLLLRRDAVGVVGEVGDDAGGVAKPDGTRGCEVLGRRGRGGEVLGGEPVDEVLAHHDDDVHVVERAECREARAAEERADNGLEAEAAHNLERPELVQHKELLARVSCGWVHACLCLCLCE